MSVSTSPAGERTRPGGLDSFFHISERGSTIGREVRGGLVTFFAMAYILVVNASVLSAGAPSTISPAAIAAGTALVAGIMTILMGVVANFPMGLAAGMGLNAIVAFTLANPDAMGLTYAEAMGLIFWEGVAITVLVLTGFRGAVFRAVPAELKTAISVGIGLFICFVGLINAGIVRPGGTYVQLGINGSLSGWPMLVFIVGLIIVIVLYMRNVQGAILIGIAAATVIAVIIQALAKLGVQGTNEAGEAVNVTGWATNAPALDGSPIQLPDFATLGHIDFFGAFEKLGPVAVILIVFSLMLADFFDTMGTMVAVGAGAHLLDERGNPPRTREVLLIDSLAAVAGGLGGVSSNTSYVESTSGVAEGARTGLASIVTGAMFILSIFIAPLVELVPAEAASISLIFVGFLMMMNVADIDWRNPLHAVPCFLTIAMMPFAYSITAGIGFGFIAFVITRVAAGKARDVKTLMWIVSALFVIYFCLGPIEALLA
ncbi:NCS2 family permease [Nanchangia anserum]|uniref:NCS2 family permease n=1 Tax=Nanchangia anserum TaxID=2692125 RepID=A0A8I0GD85_9ACTO|nr:NCS2 family permease [Nanchangia anserum]MBD3690010.1 NCS2 family permease [Nanchangia anserum]QOX82190.1 NCS2 family permease [Nanchangia anserum]